MPKTSSRRLRNYERQDFNALLGELKKEKPAEADFQVKTEEKKQPSETAGQKPEKQVFSLYRQRIFSNENVKFIYSKNDRILHEKHCQYVKEISDEELQYSESYLSNMRQCPACAAEAYLRIGAKDPEYTERYKEIFEQCGITLKQLRNMFLVRGMKTRITGNGFLISYKEDTWKIQLISRNGHVQLLHNNYRVIQGGRREFVRGFHVQNPHCTDVTFGYALGLIRNYDYSPENAEKHTLRGEDSASGRNKNPAAVPSEERTEEVRKLQEQKDIKEPICQKEPAAKRGWESVKAWFKKCLRKMRFKSIFFIP